MSLQSRNLPAGCHTGPSVKRKPPPSFSNAALTSCRDSRHVPVGRRDLVENHPDGLARQLAHLRDRVRHAPGDLVLAIFAVPLVDRDVDERHAQTSVSNDVGNWAVRYHAGGGATTSRPPGSVGPA